MKMNKDKQSLVFKFKISITDVQDEENLDLKTMYEKDLELLIYNKLDCSQQCNV